MMIFIHNTVLQPRVSYKKRDEMIFFQLSGKAQDKKKVPSGTFNFNSYVLLAFGVGHSLPLIFIKVYFSHTY